MLLRSACVSSLTDSRELEKELRRDPDEFFRPARRDLGTERNDLDPENDLKPEEPGDDTDLRTGMPL